MPIHFTIWSKLIGFQFYCILIPCYCYIYICSRSVQIGSDIQLFTLAPNFQFFYKLVQIFQIFYKLVQISAFYTCTRSVQTLLQQLLLCHTTFLSAQQKCKTGLLPACRLFHLCIIVTLISFPASIKIRPISRFTL
jgi:hypothetical protein